jgi:hypothetical protein
MCAMSDFMPTHNELTSRIERGDCADPGVVQPAWQRGLTRETGLRFVTTVPAVFSEGLATEFSGVMHSRMPEVVAPRPGMTFHTREATDQVLDTADRRLGMRGVFGVAPTEPYYSDSMGARYLTADPEASAAFAPPNGRRLVGALDVDCLFAVRGIPETEGRFSAGVGAQFLITERNADEPGQDLAIELDPRKRFPKSPTDLVGDDQYGFFGTHETPTLPFNQFYRMQQVEPGTQRLTGEAVVALAETVTGVLQTWDARPKDA